MVYHIKPFLWYPLSCVCKINHSAKLMIAAVPETERYKDFLYFVLTCMWRVKKRLYDS